MATLPIIPTMLPGPFVNDVRGGRFSTAAVLYLTALDTTTTREDIPSSETMPATIRNDHKGPYRFATTASAQRAASCIANPYIHARPLEKGAASAPIVKSRLFHARPINHPPFSQP